jgi:MazG family protein
MPRTRRAGARTTRAGPKQTGGRSKRKPAAPDAHAAAAGRAFASLVSIMAHLRGPRGCPWDREQTLESLRGFVLEETHEVLEAIDRGDLDGLKGEIGDLLFEGVFLAQICADEGAFTVADSLDAITAKLIRRHPHVFDPKGRPLKTAGQVVQQWEQIKAREQTDAGQRRSLLGGLARSLPALLRAHEIGTRVAAVGFARKTWSRRSKKKFVSSARRSRTKARRARKKRWAICSSRSRTWRESWASSRSPRSGARTRSSRRAFRRSRTTRTIEDERSRG